VSTALGTFVSAEAVAAAGWNKKKKTDGFPDSTEWKENFYS
jgi:hypothetical protein